MYAVAVKRILLLAAILLLPMAHALGPADQEANVFSNFISTSWDRLSEAAGNPWIYGIGVALAILLFAAATHLPPEGLAVAGVVGTIIVAQAIPLVGLIAAFVIGALIGLAFLKLFAAR